MSRARFADYAFRSYAERKFINALMCGVLFVAALAALIPLFSVFGYVFSKGIGAINLDFFTQLPKPVGETGGGMANAVVGTLTLIGLACCLGVPWGMSIGIYLSEYGRGKLASFARFAVDLLASTPSIIIGMFVYVLIVMPMKHFSALSGGVALGILMVPTVARNTEEILKLVPVHIREAGLALGLPRWKVILMIVVRGSMSAIATGIILSLARVAGETAPLLFTSFNNQFWGRGLDQPMAALPVQIYTYAISPFEDWHQKAWAGALVLVFLVFLVNLTTRVFLRRKGA